MKPSKSFEQQIHRVYEFLEGSGAQVTWDDHIPDPDNPSQPRQIDITIKRDGKLPGAKYPGLARGANRPLGPRSLTSFLRANLAFETATA